MLVAGLVVDSMGLASVLVHAGVHELNDVVSDGGGEDGRHGDAVDDFSGAVLGVNAYDWSGGHLILDTAN